MISAFGPGHDGIDRGVPCDGVFAEFGRDKRQFAGDDDDAIVARGGKRGVEPRQRTAVGNTVGYATDPRRNFSFGASSNQQNVVGQLTQDLELMRQDGSSADMEGAFIAAAETARLTTGENCCTCHYPAILPLPTYA